MSPLDDIPQPWRTAMENAGVYSLRELSGRTGIGTTTVSNLIGGRNVSSERTMQAVADTLRLPVTTIRDWAATARGEAYPFILPAEANRLSRRQRDALLAVVRAMLDPKEDETLAPPPISQLEGIRLAEEEAAADAPARNGPNNG